MAARGSGRIEVSDKPSDVATAKQLMLRGRPGLADMPKRARTYAVEGGALVRLATDAERRVHPVDGTGAARTVDVIASVERGRVVLYCMVGSIVPVDADGRRDEAEHRRLTGAFDMLVQTRSIARIFPGEVVPGSRSDPETHRRLIASRRFEPDGWIVAAVVNDVPTWR